MFNSKKTENIYLWGVKIPVFLIPFLPVYISTSMVFPYITGKNFAFRILVEIAAVCWIGLIAVDKKYRPNNSLIVLSILFFTFIVGIADLFGVNPYSSFWSNYERMEGYISILHLTLYFFMIRSVLQTRKDWLIFFNIILLVSLIVSLYSLSSPTLIKSAQFSMEYKTRIYGTVGNPPFLAAYMLFTIFIGFITFLNTEKKHLRVFYIILILLNTAVIYLTATRGAILSGFIGLTIMSAFYVFTIGRRQKWRPINVTIAIAIIICLITVFVITIKSNKTFERDITISRLASMLSDDSVKARLDSWKMAWNGIKERPLLGWGQENFVGIYAVNPIPFKGEQIWTDRAHNIVIEWLMNAGIIGLLSYVAVLGSAVFTIRKKYIEKQLSKKEAVVIITALFVYFLQNLFSFDSINTYFIFFALMAYIDFIQTEKDRECSISEAATGTKITMMKLSGLTLLALLIFVVIFFFANYKPIEESRRCVQISKSVSYNRSFSTLLKDFRNALALHTFGDNDVRILMKNISHYIIGSEMFSAEGALEFLKETTIEMERGIPQNYYNLEYLSGVIVLYNRIAFYDPVFASKAESLVKWCMNINPRYERLNYVLADIYKLKKEYSKMYEIVNTMVSLDPYNDQKQFKLALAAIFMEEREVARQALRKIQKIRGSNEADIASGTSRVFDKVELVSIAKAYLSINDYHEAIDYLKQAIEIFPKRAGLYFSLANAYLGAGDKTLALIELEKAAKLDPLKFGEIEISGEKYRFIK